MYLKFGKQTQVTVSLYLVLMTLWEVTPRTSMDAVAAERELRISITPLITKSFTRVQTL